MLEELNKEALKRLYITEKRTLREIAKMFGCSNTLIRYRCLKYGIRLRSKGRKIFKIRKSVLQRLYVDEGRSLKNIGEILSCSSYTISNRCKQYGIYLVNRKKIKELNKPLLQKLYTMEGKTVREIAKIIGCSREAVRNRCKQCGIPLRPTGSKALENINEQVLRRLYIKEGKSITEISKIFGCVVSTISQKVKRFGLKEELKRESSKR